MIVTVCFPLETPTLIFALLSIFPILQGTFLVTQAVSRHMIQSKVGNGSIINIASIVGKVSYRNDCVTVFHKGFVRLVLVKE